MKKSSLGIIGGGQLGMFLCQAAKKENLRTVVFSTTENFSARDFCDFYLISDFNNNTKIDKFIDSADIFTIETENIPTNFLKKIEKKKKLFPKSNIIEISQNRLKEKKFLNSIENIKTVNFKSLNNFDDLLKSFNLFNHKAILKTCELGYDGKGQFRLNTENIDKFKNFNLKNYILEELINFKKEISVIVCRSQKNIITYPPVENIHKDSILRETIFPANISHNVKENAISIAKSIANKLDLEGILAVEMFVMKDNTILVNEIAPRPHNSGHWTMDFCKTSQFDNLICSILYGKIKKPNPLKGCRMINVIGNDYSKKDNYQKKYNFYDYFKDEIKELRKMAHYTFTD